jgi:dolichol-phosphate mannosyltransferase
VIYVVLPALNEARTIARTVERLAEVSDADPREFAIVLVDDGSDDSTASMARAAAEGRIGLTVLRHEQNLGLGAAVRTGMYWCLERATEGDAVAMLDADDTHPPDLLPAMVDLVQQGRDVVIASRYQAGAVVSGVPASRRALSGMGRWLFRLAFPIAGVRDYTCGYRCYGIAALRRAQQVYGDELCTQRGFEATVDLLLRLRQVGISAAEVPLRLDYGPRVGQSKMRVWHTVRGTLWLLARRLVERFTVYRPGRVRSLLDRQVQGTGS